MDMKNTKGTVVISSAGHDCGHWFVITGADERYVFIADGKERKLAAPKRKNYKHIRKTAVTVDITDITDRKLRSILNVLSKQSIAEESEKLV